MEPRKLKALLAALRSAGVASFSDGTVSVTFAGEPAHLVEAPAPTDAEMELPSGVIDPRRALADIYRKKAGARS
jgi:hypothetical protein